MTDHLEVWAIYRSPSDYPGQYVARKFLATVPDPTPTTEMFTAATLGEIRALLPPGLNCFDRDDSDDPKIVETWL